VKVRKPGGGANSRLSSGLSRKTSTPATADARSIPPARRGTAPAAANAAAHAYYVLDVRNLKDAGFTTGCIGAQEIEALSPSWCVATSPNPAVAAPPADGFLAVRHRISLLSLENAFSAKSCRLVRASC